MGALYFVSGIQSLFFTILNNSGSAPIWSNWIICSILTVILASCIAEVCSMYQSKSIFGQALWSCILSFPLIVLFLFCQPSSHVDPNLSGSIVTMYVQVFGLNTQSSVIGLSALLFIFNTVVAMLASSRLLFTLARDGIFHHSLAALNSNGQPWKAILLCYIGAFVMLITTLMSTAAYTSIISASVICILLSYGTILFGRIWLTKKIFRPLGWLLGISLAGRALAGERSEEVGSDMRRSAFY